MIYFLFYKSYIKTSYKLYSTYYIALILNRAYSLLYFVFDYYTFSSYNRKL